MTAHRYVYWRHDLPPNEKGELYANVHFLEGYNQTILAFQRMAEELRKTFPQAIDGAIRCGRVQKSSFVNNFSIIAFDTYLPEGEYPGWTQVHDNNVQYYW